MIYIHIVDLESLMLHAKFQDPKPLGSGEEDFGCLTQSLQEGFQESEILNKRTNGAVNAHLRSGIYTNKQDLAIK